MFAAQKSQAKNPLFEAILKRIVQKWHQPHKKIVRIKLNTEFCETKEKAVIASEVNSPAVFFV